MNQDTEQWRIAKAAVRSRDGVVASQHHVAAKAGASILHAGGNAVDAAVATAFALAAVEPWMCGLGGSGYLVVWLAKARSARVFDFQGVLPAGIDRADYPLDPGGTESLMGFPAVVDQRNVVGPLSISVPGAVAGLSAAIEAHGKLELGRVLEPAIALTERGLPVDWHGTLNIALAMDELRRDPVSAATYLPGGLPARPEQYLALGELAGTFKRLARHGAQDFYRGELGASIAADLGALGSRITADDLAAYEVLEAPAMSATHRGADVHTAGPTSGGPRLIEMLANSASHVTAGEPSTAATWLAYAAGLESAWASHRARTGAVAAVESQDNACTSHLSAVDADGNMVALTYTLLNRFGSGVMLPGSGILMNNAVSYFDPRAGYPTSMAGSKRINSSNMCPTVATRDGEALFAVGASGANHIMPCTAQIAALMLDHGLDIEAAFEHPRIDASARGSVRVDPRFPQDVIDALGRQHTLEIARRLVYPKLYSCPSGVSRDPESGECAGISDPSQPVAGAAAPAPFAAADSNAANRYEPRA